MVGAPAAALVATSSYDSGSGLDSVEPFGGADAAVASFVMGLTTAPKPPETAVEYVQAHRLQESLDSALNALVQSEQLPTDPWETLIRNLPSDLIVPPLPTIPSKDVGAAAIGLDRLKQEFLWLHGFGN